MGRRELLHQQPRVEWNAEKLARGAREPDKALPRQNFRSPHRFLPEAANNHILIVVIVMRIVAGLGACVN